MNGPRKDFENGCPVCGDPHPKIDHRCSEDDLRRWEARLRKLEAAEAKEPRREFSDKLEEAETLNNLTEL